MWLLKLNITLMTLLAQVYGFFLPSFLEFGSCIQHRQTPNFDMEKFAGTWYTVSWVPNEYIPIVACSNANYTQLDDHVECRERGLTADGQKKSRITKLDLLPEGSESTFMARGEGLRPTAPINVVATDYATYACTYSCMKSFAMKAEFAWVLSRRPALDKRSIDACNAAFTAEFDLSKLEIVDQGKTCPYWSHLSPEQKSQYLFTTLNNETPPLAEEEDEELVLSVATSELHSRSTAPLQGQPTQLPWAALVVLYLVRASLN